MTKAFRLRDSKTIAMLCLTLGLATMRTAAAQSAGAQAEVMFREARVLLEAGKVAEACAAFESSQKLEPATSTLMNLASCRERNHQPATAWGLFLEAERATRDAADGKSKKLHKVALDRAKGIEPRMSKLTSKVPADSRVDRLEILRGAEAVEPSMWNRALPIDGGTYKITARAPDAPPWTVEVTIAAEADTKIVEIPRLGKPSAPVVAGKKAAGAVRASSGPPADRGGTITVPRVPPASTKRHVALGMAVSGLACGGVAAWLYFTGRAAENRSTSVNSARVDAVPVVGAAMGLAIMGGF